MLDGEPMDGGVIMPQHSAGWHSALGAVGKDGRFELTTNGTFGAYEGTKSGFIFLDGWWVSTDQPASVQIC